MLVNSAANLQNIGTNLAGNYALGKDINAGSTRISPRSAAPARLHRQVRRPRNHTISNLTIAPTRRHHQHQVGMFGTIGSTGHVHNLNITNAIVTANPNVTGPGQFIGILAGPNAGTISNVTVNSTVSNGTAKTA